MKGLGKVYFNIVFLSYMLSKNEIGFIKVILRLLNYQMNAFEKGAF